MASEDKDKPQRISLLPFFQELDGLVERLETEDHRRTAVMEFLDKSPTVCFAKSMQTKRYTWVNLRFSEVIGVDVVGKTDFEIFPEDVAENLRKTDEWVVASGEPIEVLEKVPVRGENKTWLVAKFRLQNGEPLIGGIAIQIPQELVRF